MCAHRHAKCQNFLRARYRARCAFTTSAHNSNLKVSARVPFHSFFPSAVAPPRADALVMRSCLFSKPNALLFSISYTACAAALSTCRCCSAAAAAAVKAWLRKSASSSSASSAPPRMSSRGRRNVVCAQRKGDKLTPEVRALEHLLARCKNCGVRNSVLATIIGVMITVARISLGVC